MRKFSFVFAVLSFFAVSASYGQGDSCLRLWANPSDTTFSNPDSVMVDSCMSSATYGQKFAKGWFHLRFTYYILPTPVGPKDTIIERTWQDIDTQYVNVRNAFDTLEQRFGSFVFRKFQPHIIDTSIGRRSLFNLWFDNYVNIDTIEKAIRSIPLIEYCDYINRAGIILASVKSSKISPSSTTERIYLSRSHLLDHVSYFERFFTDSSSDEPIEVYTLNGQSSFRIKKGLLSPTDFLQKLSTLPQGSYIVTSSNNVLMIVLAN